MRDILDRYIRSLAERELLEKAPETMQDLGTLVDWIVEHKGFRILLHAFKHNGPDREKSAGRMQHGIDILASKPDPDGTERLYRFVLKRGSITPAQWTAVDGTILNDIYLAAGRPVSQDAAHHSFGTETYSRVSVVAVHNGDFDQEYLGGHRDTLRTQLKKVNDVDLDWWSAATLVDLVIEVLEQNATSFSTGTPGATLFPPGVRPFVRAVLDESRHVASRKFDISSVDRLLETVMPLGRSADAKTLSSPLSEGSPMQPVQLRRVASELLLFTEMLDIEFARNAPNLFWPVLETIERVLCRLFEHLRRNPLASYKEHTASIKSIVESLIEKHISATERMMALVEPMSQVPFGLALPSLSEAIDYSIRAYRLAGHIAVAGIAARHLDGNTTRAEKMAQLLAKLWKSNVPAFCEPSIDDVMIEYCSIVELMLICGMSKEAGEFASNIVEHLALRRRFHLPLPGLYERVRFPMSMFQIRGLVAAHLYGKSKAPKSFVDTGTTLLPTAVYVATKCGHDVWEHLDSFSALPETESPDSNNRGSACYLQTWRPPDDASSEWYAHEISRRGATFVFMDISTKEKFVSDFENFNKPIAGGAASDWGFPVVDRIAWMTWRNLPPMAELVSCINRKDGAPQSARSMSGTSSESSSASVPGPKRSQRKPRAKRSTS